MASSGTVTFSVSRDQIISDAMSEIGALGATETPSAADTTYCARRLNMLVKQWSGNTDFAPGLKMWSRKRATLFLSASTNQYSLGPDGHWASSFVAPTLTAVATGTSLTVSSISGITSGDTIGVVLDNGTLFWTTVNGAPSGSTVTLTAGLPSQASSGAQVYDYNSLGVRPLSILTAVLRDQNNDDIPLDVMTLQDYEALPSKADTTATGDPQSFYYEAQLTDGVIYFDVTPDDLTKTVHIVYLSPAQDFVNGTDTPDYSQEWYMALVMGLAKGICTHYGMQWLPVQEENYKEALMIARNSNPETTDAFFHAHD